MALSLYCTVSGAYPKRRPCSACIHCMIRCPRREIDLSVSRICNSSPRSKASIISSQFCGLICDQLITSYSFLIFHGNREINEQEKKISKKSRKTCRGFLFHVLVWKPTCTHQTRKSSERCLFSRDLFSLFSLQIDRGRLPSLDGIIWNSARNCGLERRKNVLCDYLEKDWFWK